MEMIQISPGSTLTFSKGDNVTCKTVNRHQVDFEGQVMSLTASALIVIKRLGYKWGKIAGPQYWTFEGETLYDRKNRMEQEEQ